MTHRTDSAAAGTRTNVVAYVGLLLGMAMGSLDSTIVTTALPTIAGDLNGVSSSGWVMTAYLLTSALATPVWGRLSDAVGRKRPFVATVLVFLAGSVLCAVSSTMTMLVVMRAVQGVGAGGLTALGLAAAGDLFSPRERGRYSGYSAAVYGGAVVLGPVLGGALTQWLGWPSIFLINMPIGAASLAIVTRYFRVPVHRRPFRLDLAGIVLLSLSLLAVLLLLDLGGKDFAWVSWRAALLLALGVVALVGFVWVESRTGDPLVPLRLFRDRVYVLGVSLAGAVSMSQMVAIFVLPTYLQLVKGVDPARAGLTLIPLTLCLVAASLVSGQVLARSGRYKAIMIAGSGLGVVGGFMLTRVDVHSGTGFLLLATVLLGLGLGACGNVTTVACQNAVSVADLGVATSTLSLLRSVGQAAGSALAGAVATIAFRHAVTSEANPAQLTALRQAGSPANVQALAKSDPGLAATLVDLIGRAAGAAFAVGFVAAVVALVCALMIKEQSLRKTSPAAAPSAE